MKVLSCYNFVDFKHTKSALCRLLLKGFEPILSFLRRTFSLKLVYIDPRYLSKALRSGGVRVASNCQGIKSWREISPPYLNNIIAKGGGEFFNKKMSQKIVQKIGIKN